ncbi:MAG: LapA family protein [Gammaproteobacteria bacterium]|nr:LapA family protein [Gammaproteobacteria bacterium]
MHKLIRFLAALFILLVFFASVGFSYINTTPAPLSLGFWEFSPQPVALWIISAFALGGTLGLLFATGISSYFKNKIEIRRLQNKLKASEAEVSKLRNLSSKDIR